MTSINDNPGPLPTLKVAKKRKRKLEAPELAEANKYFDSGAIAIGDGEKTVSVVVSNGPGVS
jgi:hypothetical protein